MSTSLGTDMKMPLFVNYKLRAPLGMKKKYIDDDPQLTSTSKTFPSLLCCRRWVGDKRGNCLYAKIGYNWSGTGKKHEKKLPMGPTLFRSGSSSSQQSHSPTIGLSARYGCEYSGFYIYIHFLYSFQQRG